MKTGKPNQSVSRRKKSLKPNGSLRARQLLGKYKIIRMIGSGGFAKVYSALDTIEGVQVALKIPHEHFVDEDLMEDFKREVRMVARLDHPNILTLKDANIIDGRFVVVTLLGNKTLDERLTKRIAVPTALNYVDQMIAGLAYAHDTGIIHCDIKPENYILFEDDHLRLADFGIAKVSVETVQGAGTGTVGHMAPEQAMGRPNARSDVFSLGLIMYRLLAGDWPEYPFAWPPPGAANLRRKRVHPDLIKFIRKAISPLPRDRFANAVKMEEQFEVIYPKALRHLKLKRGSSK